MTADGDLIDYTITAGSRPANEVKFVLKLGPGLPPPHAWRKELVLRGGAGGAKTIGLQDAARSGSDTLARQQLAAGSLLFRKAGIMTDIHSLGGLGDLPQGALVTFTWTKD